MTSLERLRHSTAHVLATAVTTLWPDAQLAAGPPVENGFYYDMDLAHRITPEDFPAIEAEMAKVIAAKQPFVRKVISRDEAIALGNAGRLGSQTERAVPSQFKLDILNRIDKDAVITLYQNGEFIDLCEGVHVSDTSKIGAFKLTNLSSSYYQGKETNPQLQRVYGTAFPSKKQLDEHFAHLEEARKRDHRRIGAEMKLFQVDARVGSGLPVLLPKGAILRRELERMIEEKLFDYGYQPVYSPHIGAVDLYKTSGHYPFYAESMYDTVKIEEREFLLKPMNCPMHIQAYASEPRSYRDLPQRYAEFGTVYRKEQSGELNGLVRVRGFTQDDGHLFCTPEQLEDEFRGCLRMIQEVMTLFGFTTKCRISLRDKVKEGKYVGSDEDWNRAEAVIRKVVEDLKLEHTVGLGEAAFYGPKLDFMAYDCLNRSWQIATIQVDFGLPQRFQLEYTGSDGHKHVPVMIHRAVFGSIERFMGLVIEHFAGAFPTWLAPEQVRVLPIKEEQQPYAEELMAELKKRRIRATLDNSRDNIGPKISNARNAKVPYILVLGAKEVAEKKVAVRSRKLGDEGAQLFSDFLERVTEEIQTRAL
ncbi:MAG: threonine--tRNA ligase [Candidatus Methylacidiphilales bacterium]|nr:threonine--tRNA ligase [Candidatus Methylacidiphilales bacterium]